MAIIVVTSILACGLGTIGVVSAMNEWNPEAQNLPTYEFQGGTHVLYRDEIPLKVQDLTEVDPENYSYRLVSSDESFLLSRTDAYQRPRYDMLDQPEISYTILEVKAEFFCDFVLDKLLETDRDFWSEDIYGNITYDEYRQVDASPWSADCAYQLCNGENAMSEYLLCYGNTFVILDLDWIPTQEQMEKAGEILGK